MSSSSRNPMLAVLVLLVLPLLLFTWAIRPVHAAAIVVNSAADVIAANGECTLREAMNNANSDSQSGSTDCVAGSGADTITFAANYTITLDLGRLPIVTTEMTITGNGAANTIIQASTCDPVNLPGGCTPAGDRVLFIQSTGNLTLNDLTIRHGQCANSCDLLGDGGGGILNNLGTLTISNSLLTKNQATYGGAIYSGAGDTTITDSEVNHNTAEDGGGIYFAAASKTLNLTRTTFDSNNASDGSGGGLTVSGGTINIIDSTFVNNDATEGGGGAYLFGSGAVVVKGTTFETNNTTALGGGAIGTQSPTTVANSTFSGNTALGFGGAILQVSNQLLGVHNSTFFANSATVGGGGIGHLVGLSNINVMNSLFVANTPGGNCFDVTSVNAGSIADDNTCGSATQKTAAEINLGPLAGNGGPTRTHALQTGSHAIDFASSAECIPAPVSDVDQRDEPRNVDIPGTGNDGGGNLCDVGAYELQGASLTITKATDPAGGTGFPFTIDPTNYSFDFTWGSNGIAVFQFREPTDIAIDSDGNVIVADLGNFRVSKYQPNGIWITTWGLNGSPGSEEGMFDLAYGVAADDSGNIYVSDRNNQRVQKFDNNGNFQLMWGWGVDDGSNAFQTCTSGCQAGISGSGAGQFNLPWGIGVDAAGNVFVSENGGERIQKFDGNGTLLATWGSTGTAEAQFNDPAHLAVDPSGNVYVMDTGNNRVQKFDNNGNFLLMWGWGVDDGTVNFQTCTSGCEAGSFGSAPGQFFNALGIEVDAAGNVYVADSSNHRFQKFTADGEYLTLLGIGSPGNGNGEFNFPIGLGVNAEGKVYVADSFNDRIQVIAPDVSTILDDGQSESFNLLPGTYRVSELVPDGWTLDNISCDGGQPITSGATVEVTLGDGADVTCTFSNSRPPSFCPVDASNVGNEMTDLIGTGQGSPTKGFRTRKLVVPNSDEVVALYGQLAAVDVGVMKYVRFLPQGYPKVQLHDPTSLAYRPYAVDWWGADLPTHSQWVKGQFFWGAKANKAPRAFVLWPTYETAEPYANVFVTFDESSENHVAAEVGWFSEQTHVLAIPETQADGATVVVRLAIVDNNKDTRPVWLSVTVDGQSQGNEDTEPNAKDTLNLYEFTFEDVAAGVDEVTIRLESPPPGELALLGGDSAAMIGAAVSYACEIPVP